MQRQIIELAVDASAEAPAVHRELARPFWDRAVPELERVFDAAAGPGELLRVDRLEIDLGSVDGIDWTTEFRRKLIAELARSLAKLAVASRARDGNARTDSQPAEPWRQFVFFLIHGRLPWWGARPEEGWTDALLRSSDAAGWSALREAVRSHPHARARIVHVVGDDFLDTAIAKWSGLRHGARVLEQLTPKGLRAGVHRQWRREFWSLVIEWVSAGGFHSLGGPELVRDLLTLRHLYVSDSEQGGPPRSLSGDESEPERPNGPALDDHLPDPWHGWQMSQGDRAIQRAALETATGAGTMRRPAPSRSPSRERASADHVGRRPVEDEAIYVEGAGAILLHPFFEQLFRERGLLTGRTFRDTDARTRGVHLMGLLTFGSIEIPEYDLVLAKRLCGADLDEPLEPTLLDEHDVAACDALLRAVIEHWTALRSSSPQWMREQFFLREGKLETVDSGCLLTIERRAQDVLLARLPWDCGFVALPWLPGRIFVRWLD